MNHRRKKLLAVSLSIIMMLTMFPLAAITTAAEPGGCGYAHDEDCDASVRQTVSDTVVIASFEALPCHVAWQQFAPPPF